MSVYRSVLALIVAVVAVSATVAGQQTPPASPRLPLAPSARSGSTVAPAFEGWFTNPDGTIVLVMGYMNRNQREILDVPVGPNNRIEPGGPDYGQPTHFQTGRVWANFTITVPKDFGTKKLTWTLVTNGQTETVALWASPAYVISPLLAADTGNTPPILKFDPAGPEVAGPQRGTPYHMTAVVNEPVPLAIWATDRGVTVKSPTLPPVPNAAPRPSAARRTASPPIAIEWSIHRRPGTAAVKFASPRPAVSADAEAAKLFATPGAYSGKATTTVTFSEPGDYVLRAQANDSSPASDGRHQCCFTNALVKVTVGAAGGR